MIDEGLHLVIHEAEEGPVQILAGQQRDPVLS